MRWPRRLGIDPLAFRLKNLVEEGDLLTGGEPQVRTGAREVLDALAGAGIWNENPPERVGSDGLLHGRGLGASEVGMAAADLAA